MTPADYPPPRRRGRNIQLLLILVLAAIVSSLAVLATLQPLGLLFTGLIGLAVLAFIPIPILVYRLYALSRANYQLDRDQLTITWGLRVELIPVSDIEWVRPLSGMPRPFPLPFIRLPGGLLGVRRHPDLGPIEFMASEGRSLLLVATSRQVFAISPENPDRFMQDIQHAIEMGSLSPALPRSVYPSFVVAQAQ
jgi:hypothetical protein